MHRTHSRNIRLVLAALTLAACSSIECPVQNTVATHYAFVRQASGSIEADTLSDTLYVWTPRADGTDTLLLNRAIAISDFQLPVSYQHPEDTLIFYFTSADGSWAVDTLWLKKDDIPHFESVDCSAHFFHQLTGVRCTTRRLAGVTIVNANVDYDPSTIHLNIELQP